MKLSITQAAAKNGISASVAYNRINAGWSRSDAISVPTRTYKLKVKPQKKKADIVWAYLLKNPLATYVEIAKNTGVSYGYAYFLKNKVGTPPEVFEREADRQVFYLGGSARAANDVDDTSRLQTLGDRIRKWWKAA